MLLLIVKDVAASRSKVPNSQEASTYPRSCGAPTLKPLAENVLALRQAGYRRRWLYLAHHTLSLVQCHFTLSLTELYSQTKHECPNPQMSFINIGTRMSTDKSQGKFINFELIYFSKKHMFVFLHVNAFVSRLCRVRVRTTS